MVRQNLDSYEQLRMLCRRTFRLLTVVLAAAALGAIACVSGVADQPEMLQRFERTEPHMGTKFSIAFYADDETSANRAFAASFARIAELERVFSDYDVESEISRLSSQSPTKRPISLSNELATVLAFSQKISQLTDGAFDITVGPYVHLWRRARREKKLPDPERMTAARLAIGYQGLIVDAEKRTAQLLKPHMRLDVGAIAKGYTCDVVLDLLRTFGIQRALVNGGGGFSVGDPPPGKTGWPIRVSPLADDQDPVDEFELANAAIATSGDRFQNVEIDGRRYSHILDPATGIGLTQRSSVSVIAPTGMEADALSTAITVMGPLKGLALLRQRADLAGLIVVTTDVGDTTYRTETLARFILK